MSEWNKKHDACCAISLLISNFGWRQAADASIWFGGKSGDFGVRSGMYSQVQPCTRKYSTTATVTKLYMFQYVVLWESREVVLRVAVFSLRNGETKKNCCPNNCRQTKFLSLAGNERFFALSYYETCSVCSVRGKRIFVITLWVVVLTAHAA